MKYEITSVAKSEAAPVQFKSLNGLAVRIAPDGQLITLNGLVQTVVASSYDAADWWETNVCKTRYNATRWKHQHNRLKAARRGRASA
jgi:hypothetical protein